MDNTKLAWKAREFKSYKKTRLWYICFFVISAGLIVYALYIHNILTLITFALLSFATFLFSHQNPEDITYELTSTGIISGQIMYPYRNIKNFWIIYTPENRTLNFETTAYLNNQVSIELGKQDPVQIKQFLKTYLPEDLDKEESFTDILARKIKF